MKYASRLFLIGSMVITVSTRSAAQQAVQFIIPQLDHIYAKDGFPSTSLGIGYANKLNRRLSWGLDFTVLIGSVLDFGSAKEKFLYYGNYEAGYKDHRHGYCFTYRTACALGDPDRFSPYIGASVGLMRMGRDIEVIYQNANSYPYYDDVVWKDTYSATATVFPIQVRLGWRTHMDQGIYSDLYFSMGYMAGAGDPLFPQAEMEELQQFSRMTYSIGYAFGIAWE